MAAKKTTGKPVKRESVPAAPPKKLSIGWLTGILVLAAVLRLYALGSVPRGFYGDEAMDGNNAAQALETGQFHVFYPENNGREGLYINLSAPFVLFLGNTIAAMRLVAAISGILTVWLVYLLGAGWFSARVGLIAAFLLSCSTWHLHNSRLTSRANLSPLFLCLTLYLLAKAFERRHDLRSYLIAAVGAGIAYGLGLHTYINYRVTPVLVAAFWFWWLIRARREKWTRQFWLGTGCFTAAAVIVMAPLLLYFYSHPGAFTGRAGAVAAWNSPTAPPNPIWTHTVATAQMFFDRGDHAWRHNISDRRELFLPVAVVFGVGLAVTLVSLIRARKNRFLYGFLMLWMAVAAVPSILSADEIHALRTTLMIPAVFLIAGLGGEWLWDLAAAILPAAPVKVLAVVFCIAVIVDPVKSYFVDWATHEWVARSYDAWLVDVAAQIRAAGRGKTRYIVIPYVEGENAGIPVLVQAVPYLTRSYTENQQKQANIRYIVQTDPRSNSPAQFCDQARTQHADGEVFCVAYKPDLLAPAIPVHR